MISKGSGRRATGSNKIRRVEAEQGEDEGRGDGSR